MHLNILVVVLVVPSSLWALLQENITSSNDGLTKIYWHLNGLKQEDPTLIQAIQNQILIPPDGKPLNCLSLSGRRLGGQFGHVFEAEKILKLDPKKNAKKGFFIEAGAADGELISNSLYFEVVYGWTGLLVEPDPTSLSNLYGKHRNAWILPHCLSTKKGWD